MKCRECIYMDDFGDELYRCTNHDSINYMMYTGLQAAIDAIVKWAEDHNENPDGDDCIMILQEISSEQPIGQEEPHRCIDCYYGGRPTYKFPCCSCDISNKFESLRRDK